MMMRKFHAITFLALLITLPALADKRVQGNTTLKDSQPTGTQDKHHKHQAYDLSFDAEGKAYTCRTDSNQSMNATDFVVGTSVKYEIDGKNAKIRTPEGKEVGCKIVRVEVAPAAR
jgi:uncharacterized protein YcfJ